MRRAIVDLDELPGLFREAIRATLAEHRLTLAIRAPYGDGEVYRPGPDTVESALDALGRACAKSAGVEVDRGVASERVFDVMRGHALFDGADIEDTIGLADDCVGAILEERKPTKEH